MENADRSRFWIGKRVLITGGNGFVATSLATALSRLDAIVVVTLRHHPPALRMDLLQDGPRIPAPRRPDIEFCDLSSTYQVQEICNRHQIDTIFHLAASAIVIDSARAPLSTMQNNVISTLNVLETARINNIPRVVIASSDKAYGDHTGSGDPEGLPYVENHALRGFDNYSASKVCTDVISQTYALQFDVPVIVTRCCNIYGPGDLNFSRLIPRTIMRLLSGNPPQVNEGNENVLREYVYIDDVVNAYMFLAENLEQYYANGMPREGRNAYGWSAFNVGSYVNPARRQDPTIRPDNPNIRSVLEVILAVERQLGTGIPHQVLPRRAPFIEIPDQFLDSSKIHNLGFRTQVNLEQGIASACQWYREKYDDLKRIARNYLD